MNAHDAHMALVPLIAGTSGWTDESIRFFTSELTGLSDPDVLADACRDVLWAWKRTARPTLADIAECYNNRLAKVLADDAAPCSSCDGTGWVDAVGFHASYCRNTARCHCHAVRPCPDCAGGDPGPAGRQPQLEAPAITLDDYIARVERRVEAGNAEAAEELAMWRKHRHSPFGRALVPEGSR